MTMNMLLGTQIKSSLTHGPRISFEYLPFRDNLSVLYEDLLYTVGFPILVELNGSFEIGVLLFGLIGRIIRI